MGPPPSVVRLAEWAAWRWAGPVSSFLGRPRPNGWSAPCRRPARTPPCRLPRQGEVQSSSSTPPWHPGPVTGSDAPARRRSTPCSWSRSMVHRTGPDGVLVLAPSHRRAAAVESRLRDRGVPVALLPDGWDRSAAGGSVTVGTRVAAWAPIPRLRAAVVLDAHDEAYREQRAPTWSATDVVIERARRDGAPVMLVSPCPTVVLSEGSAARGAAPSARVAGLADRRGGRPSRRRPADGTFLRTAAAAPCGTCSTGRPAWPSASSTGSDGFRCCPAPSAGRWPAAPAVVRPSRWSGADGAAPDAGARWRAVAGIGGHLATVDALVCRRCEERRPVQCAVCDNTRLRTLRMGVTRATEELSALMGVTAVELTADHDDGAAARGPHWWSGPKRPSIGFQRPSSWPSSTSINTCSPRASWPPRRRWPCWPAPPACSVSRDRGGRLLVQTRLPDHDAVRAAARADPSLLADSERELRAALGLPPFGALAVLIGPGASPMAAGCRIIPVSPARRPGPTGGWCEPRTMPSSATPWPKHRARPSECG